MIKQKMTDKERLLEVLRILEKETDEAHPLTMQEILAAFPATSQVGEKGLRSDLTILENSTSHPISWKQKKNGLPKYYYYDARLFEIHELRLLMDAIVAAKFISEADANQLLMKIRSLTSDKLAYRLQNKLHKPSENDGAIVDSAKQVHTIHESIYAKKQIQFQYGDYTVERQFKLRYDGAWYEIHPYALVWERDRYYLIGYSLKDQEVRHYRVDRMRHVESSDIDFLVDPEFDLSKKLKHLVHMYDGEEISLEADFHPDLINTVIDYFGLDANIERLSTGDFKLKIIVANSDGLFGWLLRWGSRVKVHHPPHLVNKIKKEIADLHVLYQEINDNLS